MKPYSHSVLLGITFSLSANPSANVFCWTTAGSLLGNASSPEKDFGCGTEYFNYLTKAASIHNEGPYSPSSIRRSGAWTGRRSTFRMTGWLICLMPKRRATVMVIKPSAINSPKTLWDGIGKVSLFRKEDLGKHLYLQFDGIFRDARIWINGFCLGHEPSGYAARIIRHYGIPELRRRESYLRPCGCHARGLVLRGCGHLPPCMAEQDGAVACSSFRRICIFHAGSSFRQGCAGDRSADEEFGKRPRLRQSMVPSA